MGTSVNQGSRATPGWRAAAAGYRSKAVPLERIVQEVWRAASRDTEGAVELLQSRGVYDCLRAVLENDTAAGAIRRIDESLPAEGQASFVTDLAKRATLSLPREVVSAESWTGQLLAQVTDYFVSRDLPNYVGTGGRLLNPSAVAAFKGEIRDVVRGACAGLGPGPGNHREWRRYVAQAIKRVEAAE